ncbi:MAG: hypothetical protein IKM61_07585 [Eubacteriaceae bacterium]|nr:hypothetical protein [Eubacteriaceae bacterium]
MKVISHTQQELNNIVILNGEVYEIISEAVSEDSEEDEGGSLLQGVDGYAGGRLFH